MIQEFPMHRCKMAHRIAVFGASIIFAVSVAAHHGPNVEPLYDTSQLVEFEGEVTEVFWHNPHARIRIRRSARSGNLRRIRGLAWRAGDSPISCRSVPRSR